MNVLLLRSPTSDVPDKYEAMFHTHGYSPISVPVLETTLVHLEQLADRIAEGPSVHRFTGVVVTSKRSIEGWGQAAEGVVARSRENVVDRGVRCGDEGKTSWAYISFYVVREVTAEAVRELGKRLPRGLGPTDVRGCRDVSESKKMLYLTGDKNRDMMPRNLTQGGVGLEELQVYETHGSSTFVHDLEDGLRGAAFVGYDKEAWGWIVFFAPSAARHVYPALCDHFFFRRLVDTGDAGHGHARKEIAKVAAIGPMTVSFLRDELGLRVDVVAPKLIPAELASTIIAFDSASHSV
ncbi:tetrapyrrole biosynthesis, uroporphyrinogen III synthase [Pisolithus sp. B1]|nr:tetrapyrrole biosynthesis, uroporphyrinogen III synthase [Pisolithus sp. B1]